MPTGAMDSNGLGKLLPKVIVTKRRLKKQQTASDVSGDDPPRGRYAASTESEGTTSSLNMAEEEDPSVVSYESDHESPGAERPTTISTHPSQIGYLTTSSPLVQADHLQGIQPPDREDSSLSQRASTFSPDTVDSLEQAPASSLASSKTGLAPPSSSKSRRSPSPLGRFRDSFRSRKGSAASGSPSPERKPLPSAAPETEQATDPQTTFSADSAQPPASQTSSRKSHSSQASRTSQASLETSQTAENPASSKAASGERFRRLSRGQKIDTSTPPRTPPTNDKTGTPVIVNTPPTPTDSNHPIPPPSIQEPTSPDTTAAPTTTSQTNASTATLGSMISQRRGRSDSGTLGPSKLSNITLAPLTPTPENGPSTPSASGFFSSMFSAAQSATNSLSNTITNTNIAPWHNKKGGGSTTGSKEHEAKAEDDKVEVEPSAEATSEHPMESKELAVKTLGMGDLSLSQLGIVEPSSRAGTPAQPKFPESIEGRARSESAPPEPYHAPPEYAEQDGDESQPTFYDATGGQDEKPAPAGSIYDDKTGIQRTSSIRSAVGGRRKRGSSAATGGTATTIAAAIAAANASVAHPTAATGGPKLTGFAVASKKRNRDFHTLFKSVPDDDYLIEDYSCALQREILAHGRLYVSEGHLCFSSNILGWITTLVMSFDEIVSVEKRSTALVFKNGLMISTLHAKHIFASFTSRDSTYDLIVKIWKLGHPSLQSSLNGVRIDETGGDKTEKIEADGVSLASQSASASEDESEDGEDVYDEDEEDDEAPDTTQLTDPGSLDGDTDKAAARKPSAAAAANGTSAEKPKEAPATSSEDFPGPTTHGPTECGDVATHYDKFLADETIPAPLGKTFSLMFGKASVSWMSKWLTTDQKCTDLQMEDQKGLGPDNRTRTFSYIKPLYASIGPKQTKCIVTEQIDNIDFEKAVNVSCTTQNPDVPSGNVFSVKTKYCLSWGENNSTRVQVNCTIEWTGKSWLKGPIEKGANEGQLQYCKELFASLKAAVTSRPRSGTLSNGAAAKGKKKGRKGKAAHTLGPTSDTEGPMKPSVHKDWGMLEPVHGLVGPVVDIVGPLLTGNVVYGLLVGLLVATWFGFGLTNWQASRHGQELGYLASPYRLAAYEEMWRGEESDLWDWLEERVGLYRLQDSRPPTVRKKVLEPRTVEEKLREDRMDEREIKEAIRVTEERLKVLKSVYGVPGDDGKAEGDVGDNKAV